MSRGQASTRLSHRLRRALPLPPRPRVIVLGNQKSGTSAIAHLLADHAGLSKQVDIPVLWGRAGIDIMEGRATLAEKVRASPRFFRSQLLKEPMLTFIPDQVRAQFPRASWVFVVRDPRDNIRSLCDRRSISGTVTSWDDVDLGASGETRRRAITQTPWDQPSGNPIEAMAAKWQAAADVVDAHKDHALVVTYESFRAAKKRTIATLATDLGFTARHDISDRVDVAYQPRGDASATWETYFGDNLARIEAICRRGMDRLQYL